MLIRNEPGIGKGPVGNEMVMRANRVSQTSDSSTRFGNRPVSVVQKINIFLGRVCGCLFF